MSGHLARRAYLGGLLLGLAPLGAAAAEPGPGPEAVDYNRDVRPILSEHCYTCHGPDAGKRKAGLRLDRREDALKKLRSGGHAVVPGDPARSELLLRIGTEDETERMPPARTGKKLSPAQVDLLRKWIAQGARWETHWAYRTPQRPALPAVRDRAWPRNAIDHFVLARLEREGLRPSPEADRPTLIRRLSLDLTGLPPTPAEVDALEADPSPDAYEKVVDQLLASPHYGERMALMWLDLARYADTNGYRLDNHRDMWQYRDWLIDAFNRNLPFDQFTVEQLAGDLLPGATLAQKIATGFHRNTMVNFGNGSDPKEYLAKAVSDRVATTATVWLGTTLACAQCHDHKYDPFTQKDFYRFYAFFNNVPEKGLDGARGNPVPCVLTPSPGQADRLDALRKQRARVEARIRAERARTGLEGRRPDSLQKESAQLEKAEAELRESIPGAMVMEEMAQPRVTRVFIRGDYLNEGEVVTPGAPDSLPPLPRGAPANRLGLARWLVDPGHPLTSRVAINRIWQMLFGNGIVKTGDDFGAQGEAPSHPELLDWLATEFIARGWDVKAMQKLIVLSATYRQSSHVTADLLERDPHNRLLARGARFRLDAETIRDNALAVSGLLCRKLGGPSVRPYQPAGLWEAVAVGGNYTSQTYVPSQGADLYRRGMYTYWKRSLPHPSLVAFDAPTRELCTAVRPRTNTPLQALVLMNDPTYVEAARALAQRVLEEGGPDLAGRLSYAFRRCTGRPPTSREVQVLTRVYHQHLGNYRQDVKAALALVRMGESGPPCSPLAVRVDGPTRGASRLPSSPLAERVDSPTPSASGLQDVSELAAWTAVASLLLNLDETITRD
jgi:hypothetical protein